MLSSMPSRRDRVNDSRSRTLIVNLFVGQIVKRLQHQHPKHNNDINPLAAGAALLADVDVAASISARKLSNGVCLW